MRKFILACLATLLCANVSATEVTVSKPWVKGTLASQRASGAYMELFSEEGGVILGASSPLARTVEMRAMRFSLDGGPMRPEKIDQITLEPRKKLLLTPVTEHFVLLGLKGPVKAGDRFPLTLRLRMNSGEERELRVDAIGRGLTR